MHSLKKFFRDEFGDDPKVKEEAIKNAYFQLSQTSYGKYILADLLDKSEEDIAIVRPDFDSHAYALLEGKRWLARHFRNRLEVQEGNNERRNTTGNTSTRN